MVVAAVDQRDLDRRTGKAERFQSVGIRRRRSPQDEVWSALLSCDHGLGFETAPGPLMYLSRSRLADRPIAKLL
jgi:hypothetical protein